MALFLDADGTPCPDEPWEHEPPREMTPIHYQVTAQAMRERLALLGVGPQFKAAEVERAWVDALARDDSDGSPPETFEVAISEWLKEKLTVSEESWNQPKWERVLHYASVLRVDVLALLRFFLDRVPDDTFVSLDLSAVWGLHGQLPTPTFCADAKAEVQAESDTTYPTIVLTEGSSDATVLEAAVEVLRPHLLGFITFLDYSTNPVGGVDSVVKGLRAFAAAGVANRVIGLLDNDTAGKEGMRQLASAPLPDRMKGLQLPNLPVACHYPTMGTEGLVMKDINGLAVSIEMFLGEDVLRVSNGDLAPVQMKGWNSTFSQYQGEITSKDAIKKAFWAKVSAAKAGTVHLADWQDLDLLLTHIIAAV